MGNTYGFEDIRSTADAELGGRYIPVEDTPAVSEARKNADSAEGLIALGDALALQMRYREALDCYTKAYGLDGRTEYLRKMAGKELSLLMTGPAREHLMECLEEGWDISDVYYQLALCDYFEGKYKSARKSFEKMLPLYNDEMGIAVIYWHTMASFKLNEKPVLLEKVRDDMDIGHHTAYFGAVQTARGKMTPEELYEKISAEDYDVDYDIMLYGLREYLKSTGDTSRSEEFTEDLLKRDSWWITFAYLAGWKEVN